MYTFFVASLGIPIPLASLYGHPAEVRYDVYLQSCNKYLKEHRLLIECIVFFLTLLLKVKGNKESCPQNYMGTTLLQMICV